MPASLVSTWRVENLEEMVGQTLDSLVTDIVPAAGRLVLSESELISRITALIETGVIRRIGAVLDAGSLGVATVLCAARVNAERIEQVAGLINSFRQVTHNYQRDGDYNLWFTVWGKDEKDLERTVREIEEQTGVTVTRLPAVKTYKIRAVFDPA